MKLKERLTGKTPNFFKKVRNIGLALTAAGGALLMPGIGLPAELLVIAHYLIAGGAVAAAVSQAVTEPETDEPTTEEKESEQK